MNSLLHSWYKQYGPDLQAFLHNKVGEEAEDILHELFVKLHHKEHILSEVKDARKWLYTAAKRAAIDHFRRQSRKIQTKEGDDVEVTHPNVVARCLYSFIPSLSARDQKLLMAVDISGIGQKELAEEEGVPYSSIKSQVQRARKKLRKTFEESCDVTYDAMKRPIDCSRTCKTCATG